MKSKLFNGTIASLLFFAFAFLWGGMSYEIGIGKQILIGTVLFISFLYFARPFFYPSPKCRYNLKIKQRIQYIFNTK